LRQSVTRNKSLASAQFAPPLLIALLQTPHRFRTKRQLWAYCGLALETRISGEYRITKAQIERSKRLPALRGLNNNYNRDRKYLFKSAATHAGAASDPWSGFIRSLAEQGAEAHLARLTVARKIAVVVLKIWNRKEVASIESN
jgi:hypothetical protein